MLRINYKLEQSAYFLRVLVEEKPFKSLYNMHLYSAIYLWLGEIFQDMDYDVWSIESYLKCCSYFLEYPNFDHSFVTLGFVYVKIAELFLKSQGSNNDYCKLYYNKSFQALDRKFLKRNKTFIELSTFTVNYNRACIAIRLGCMYYEARNFNSALQCFLDAERLLLTIRFIEYV